MLDRKDILAKIEKIIQELIEKNKSIPIVVEGERDVIALRDLGIDGIILKINIGEHVFNFCEQIAEKYTEAIILTDWDTKGSKLCRLLIDGLSANGVKYDLTFRKTLNWLCKKDIVEVEALPMYIERLKLS